MYRTKHVKRLVLALIAIFAITPGYATEDNFFGQIGEFLNNLDIEFSVTAPIVNQPAIRQPTIIRQPVIQRPVVVQRPVIIQRPAIQRPVVQQPTVRYIPVQPQQPRYIPIQPQQPPIQPRYVPYNGGTYGDGYNSASGYNSQVTVTTTPYSSNYTNAGYSSGLSNGYFNMTKGEGYIVGAGMAMTLLDVVRNHNGDNVLLIAFSYNGDTRHVRVGMPHGKQPILKVGGKRLQLVGLERNHGGQYIRCFLTD